MGAKEAPGNYTEWVFVAMMIIAVLTAIYFFDENRLQKQSTKECLEAKAIQQEITQRFCEHANLLIDLTNQQNVLIEELTGVAQTNLQVRVYVK